MSNFIVEIKQLSKVYPTTGVRAVDELNLNIPKASVHGLLGPNGAGKTTTIDMICGLSQSDGGEIKINGLSYRHHSREIKQRIGFIPQDIALYPELTAFENLMFFGSLHRIPRKKLKSRIAQGLEVMGLKANVAIKYFSGGMKRRINILAGLLHRPQLLILDEPTVGIDVQSKNIILEYLEQLNKETGMSILYTSHLMEEAEKICDKVSIIDQGKIIEEGSPKELISKYQKENLEEVFIKLTGKQLRD